MTKKLLVLFSFLIAALSGSADEVNQSTAAQTGLNFWASKATTVKETPVILKSYTITAQNAPVYYVFDIYPKGFVIVAAEDAVKPILAYSFEGFYQADNQAPAFTDWMQQYTQFITTCRSEQRQAEKSVADAWALYSSPVGPDIKAGTKAVLPLVTTRWDQGTYYNYSCPVHASGPDGHCVTGCVATAMAQVMKYWNYPESGFGNHSYEHPFYGALAVDFSAATYNWAGMTNTANSTSKVPISLLMYHCGVSVEMNYSPIASGSFTELAKDALKNYFHYRSTIALLEKSDYTWVEWRQIIMDNLDDGKPLIYSGSGSGGGHAWVCDGYQDTSSFHMNWGWGGYNNAYFDLDNLTDFPSGHQIVANIIPIFEYYCNDQKLMTDKTRTFGDGSGYSYYWNDTDCDWLIQPVDATGIILNFTQFNTETDKDVLSVYDGTTTSDPLLGTYSGINMPPTLTSTGGSMLIVFNSDASNQYPGWEAIYTAVVPAGTNDYDLSGSTTLYPNPAHGTLHLNFSNPTQEEVVLSITNVTGQLLKSEVLPIASGNVVIDLEQLPQGVYMLSINGQQNHFCKRFVIE